MSTALVFDFGNVLAFFSHDLLCEHIAALSRGQTDAAQVRGWLFGSGRHLQLEIGQLDAEQFLASMQRELAPDAALADLRAAYTNIFSANPRVCDLIPALAAKAPIYLASNTDELHWSHFSQLFAPTFAHFTGFVKSFAVGARKPSSEFFAKLIGQVQVPATDCVFIDDLAENVAAGKKAGLQGIVYTPELDLLGELQARGIK